MPLLTSENVSAVKYELSLSDYQIGEAWATYFLMTETSINYWPTKNKETKSSFHIGIF